MFNIILKGGEKLCSRLSPWAYFRVYTVFNKVKVKLQPEDERPISKKKQAIIKVHLRSVAILYDFFIAPGKKYIKNQVDNLV